MEETLYIVNDEDSNVMYSCKTIEDIKAWLEKRIVVDKPICRTRYIVEILDANPVNKIIIGKDYSKNESIDTSSSLEKLKISDIYNENEYDPSRVKYVKNAHQFRYYTNYKNEDSNNNEDQDQDHKDEDEESDPDADADQSSKNFNKWPLEKLTVELVRKRYFDTETGKCKPIKCYSCQCYDGHEPDPDEFFDLKLTGNLIDEDSENYIIKNWIQKGLKRPDGDSGPYKLDSSNKNTFYYLETSEELPESNNKFVQIGWCGVDLTKDLDDISDPESLINNYLTEDALDSVDLWVRKE